MEKVTVASAQLQFRLRATVEECREDLKRFARAAEAKGASLLLFPARAGLMVAQPLVRDRRSRLLLRSAAGQRQSAGLWQRVSASAAGWLAQALRSDLPAGIADLLAADSAALRNVYLDLFGGLASSYGMTVVAPSAFLPDTDSGEVRHTTLVFGPGGEVIGRQSQVMGVPEQPRGISRGLTWDVIQADVARLGILIGEDVLVPEASRILALQGAEILLVQGATSGGAFPLLREGALARMQENGLYAAASYLIGEDPLRPAGSFTFMGRSGVFAPRELTPRGDCVLVEMGGEQAEGIVTAEWDGSTLRALWQVLPEEVRPSVSDQVAETIAALYIQVREAAAIASVQESRGVGAGFTAEKTGTVASQHSAAGRKAAAADGEPLHDLAELPVLGSVISRWPLEENDAAEAIAVTEAVTDWPPARTAEDEDEGVIQSSIRRDDETDEMEAVLRVEEATAPEEGDEFAAPADSMLETTSEEPTGEAAALPTPADVIEGIAPAEPGADDGSPVAEGSEIDRGPLPPGADDHLFEPEAGAGPGVSPPLSPPLSPSVSPSDADSPVRPVG